MNELYSWVYEIPKPGMMLSKIPAGLYKKIRKEVLDIQNDFKSGNPVNDTLVGHIEKEYSLKTSFDDVNQYVNSMLAFYNNDSGGYITNNSTVLEDVEPTLSSLWVNFQKKHEFNPPHDHSGIMSFVIWIKIPYDLENELKTFPNVRSGANTSKFGCMYNNAQGDFASLHLPINNTWEGVMALFPSKMIHWVNPFYTSDDYRISVSGNIKLTVL